MSTEMNQLIRNITESMPDDATPEDIAHVVIAQAGDELIAKLLLEMVTEAVRRVLNADQRRAVSNVSNAVSNGPGGPPPSYKQQQSRDWWTQELRARTTVGMNKHKLLGDCTIEDLKYCIAIREVLISQTQAQIVNYEKIIAAMKRHNATVVSDLTADQL